MKITGLSHLFKWENFHKYFFAPLYKSNVLIEYNVNNGIVCQYIPRLPDTCIVIHMVLVDI